jgi:hypothetical protein
VDVGIMRSHADAWLALRAAVCTENSDSDVVVMQSTEENM